MRIGLFGGSFNPIHAGHLGIAEKALAHWHLDVLFFIPAKVNPFKVGKGGTDVAGGLPENVRWDLVRRVCALNPKFRAWDVDLKRPDGPSYAIDTVREAQKIYPDAELFWLIGEDNVADLPRWKDWETLKRWVHFISFPRTRESSTEIRRRLVAGESIANLVPSCVADMLMPAKRKLHFIVTAGPTREYLDPVRFLSNPSTGRMGFAVARAAQRAGHTVTLIAGPVSLRTPPGVERVDVVSARDMLAAVQSALEQAFAQQQHADVPLIPCLVMTAAVADWRPADCSPKKLKKGEMSGTLKLVRNPDILKTLKQALQQSNHSNAHWLVRVGFAAETGAPVAEAVRKCREKALDLVVGNDVTAEGCGFGTPTNRVTLVRPDGSVEPLPLMSKDAIARRLVSFCASCAERRVSEWGYADTLQNKTNMKETRG